MKSRFDSIYVATCYHNNIHFLLAIMIENSFFSGLGNWNIIDWGLKSFHVFVEFRESFLFNLNLV